LAVTLGKLYKANSDPGRILIFGGTKRRCEQIQKSLRYDLNYNAVVMHGDKTQQERERALKQFKSNECSILVATDVAGRGLGECLLNR
jgi:superfamily II DNA/RNA helicase